MADTEPSSYGESSNYGTSSDASSGVMAGRSGALAPVVNRQQVATTSGEWFAPAPARPAILTAAATPVDLWHSLRRRWLQAIGAGLVLASAGAAIVWFTVPVKYEVSALLRVAAQAKTPFSQTTSSDTEFNTYRRTQAALLKSHFVLTATLRNTEISRLPMLLNANDDPVGLLERSIVVDFPHDAEIMKVSMRGEFPDQLVKIVNAVKEAYMQEVVEAERQEKLRSRDTLEQSYQKNREDIRSKLNSLWLLAKQLGTSSNETAQLKRHLALDHLQLLIRQRNNVEEQIRDLDLKILLIKKRIENSKDFKIPEYMLKAEFNRDPHIQRLTQRLMAIREAVTAEERTITRDKRHPSVARYKSMIEAIVEELDEREAELRPSLIEQYSQMPSSHDGSPLSLPLMETERQAHVDMLEESSVAVAKQFEEVQKLDQFSADLETRRSELDELQSLTRHMGYELKLKEMEALAPPRISLIENASAPSNSDSARKLLGAACAGVFGFGAALGGVAFLEFQSRRLNSPREVQEGLGLQVLGRLPQMSGRLWRKMKSTQGGQSRIHGLLAESIDSIRATLIHTTLVDSPRVVLVTSADSREGKTTVASQLAASLARCGRRTLLVDGDLRNPAAHRVFELPQEPGLCELLRGQIEGEAAVHPTRSANLWVMPAGRSDVHSVQALSGAALAQAAAAWRDHFDFVIIDSAPVLKVADPLLLGQHVDTTILSVLRDVSQVPRVFEASERLRSVGISVLGAVVNGVNENMEHHNVEAPLLESA